MIDDSSSETDLEQILESESQLTYAIEVFCGCAKLTRALAAHGFDAVGIDCKSNKDKTLAKSLWMDLSTAPGQESFWKLVFMKVSKNKNRLRPMFVVFHHV